MKNIVIKDYCNQLNCMMEVHATIKEEKIVSLFCPLRDFENPCGRVDIARFPCCLFPKNEVDEIALIPVSEPE